ncbi:MAG TPA: prephenate dehydrogenase [Candidatus Limnocylindria bacterium]|nr:prephenate dehydrogenase [Candidatus Limnocylindria bacterium]
MSAPFGTVAIVGAGQAGTMLGLALRSGGGAREITVFDRDPDVARRSVARGAAHRVTERLALDADVVVLALPVSAIVEVLARHAADFRTGSLVIDTGTAKARVVAAMRELPAGIHAIGGHPLAGTERRGPEGADPAALAGAPFALCPVRDDAEALRLAERLVRAAGARPLVIGAGEHDRIVARTSALPHLLAFALARCAARAGDVTPLAASGYAGATRLARSDPGMVASFLAANGDETRAAVSDLRGALDDLVASLDDERALAAKLAEIAP